MGFQPREWPREMRKLVERHSAGRIGLTRSPKSFELQDEDTSGQTTGHTQQCQAAGSVQAGRRGWLCRNPEAGGMWKQRQLVGVGKGQGRSGRGEAQEARGSCLDWLLVGGPPGWARQA